ncbi:MAG: alcohol dehydrogenase catalytic domain-containing protein [bacterium]
MIIRPTFCGQCPECIKGKPHLCSHNRRTIGIGDLPGGFAEYVKALPEMVILLENP